MSLIEPLNTPHRARLTVADFLVLDRSGAFDRYAKTELIGGRSSAALRTVGSDLRLTIEVAVRIDAENLPEPDMILTSFRGEGPVPCETVALAVEVSDTTLRSDLGKKAGLYPAGKIAESWVVGLAARRIVKMWQPGDAGCAQRDEVALGEEIACATTAGLRVETRGL